MAKLPRKTQKIFCGNPTSENQTSVFGTMKTDNKQYSTDVGTLQSNAAYEQGWKSATIASYKPFMEDFNTLNYINTSQLAYLFQQGIPEWDSATTYYKNSFCSYNGDLWKSLIDNNLNNAPFEGNEWTLFTSGNKGGGLELCDIGTALYVDETQGKRRILNGSIVDINNNTQAWLTRLLQIKATNPDYFTDEATWQSEATLNIDGCVYKYVLNYDSTGTNVVSVRLPKFPDYVELNDSHISSTVSIAGNGKPLRLTNGSTVGYLCGQYHNNGNNGSQYFSTAAPSLGSTASATYVAGQTGVVTDASTSGLTGKINATTSQTKLKLRYFIQIATGTETENNIVNDIELNNPFTFGMSQYYKGDMNNISWLKSNGQWNAKAVYPSYYDWAFQQLSARQYDPTKVTVVGSPTITNDGVASDFSLTNYIQITQTIDWSKPWAIKGSFNSGADILTEQMILSSHISLQKFNNKKLVLYGVNGFVYSTLTLQVDTQYDFIISYDGASVLSWSVGIKGQDLQVQQSFSRQTLTSAYSVINIGTNNAHTIPYTSGSIDLSQFSITVDGEEVYSPTKRLEGFKRSTEEYDDYDFVINTTDETFRLPLKNGQEGVFANGVKGNGKALVVTDGNGNERNLFQPGNDYIFTNDNVAGNLPHVTASYSGNQTTSYALGTNVGLTTDPTKSGIVVDTTVPDGYNLYYYVGETVQNANLIDAGRIAEEMVTKSGADGQWVEAGADLSTATATGTYTIDMSQYLPDDGYQYEVLLKIQQASTGSSASGTRLSSDVWNIDSLIAITSTVTVDCVNIFPWVIGKGRTLTKRIATNSTKNILQLLAYRRLGTNV